MALAPHVWTGGPQLGAHFYAEPLYTRTNTWELSTSNVSNPFLASFSFGPVTGTGYGIGYLIHVRAVCPLLAFWVSSMSHDGYNHIVHIKVYANDVNDESHNSAAMQL